MNADKVLSCGCAITNKEHQEPCKIVGHWKPVKPGTDWYGNKYGHYPIADSAIYDQAKDIEALQYLEQKIKQYPLCKLKDPKYNENSYLGYSECRICHKDNGDIEYKFDEWTWPNGYLHYLTEHNIAIHHNFAEYIKTIDYDKYDAKIQKAIAEDPYRDADLHDMMMAAANYNLLNMMHNLSKLTYST